MGTDPLELLGYQNYAFICPQFVLRAYPAQGLFQALRHPWRVHCFGETGGEGAQGMLTLESTKETICSSVAVLSLPGERKKKTLFYDTVVHAT